MYKIISLLFLMLTGWQTTHAQMRWNSVYQTYIDQYKDLAIQQMEKYRIPASITLAQGIFESRAGQSILATRGNNHFGIKCHGWNGGKQYHDDDEANECFRAYDNAGDSYEDHSKFLRNSPRYRRLFSLNITDYRGWAQGLKDCGYATNPAYASKLIQLIELYKLYIFDTATSYDKFMAKRSATDQPIAPRTSLHPIHIYNKNYYLYARRGDTFRSIAKEVELSYRKIAKYNERDADDPLTDGEIIYLKKKQKRADKVYKNRPHIVRPGDSMYSIAQKYGIRIKYLYKKNHLSPEYVPQVGDKLIVY